MGFEPPPYPYERLDDAKAAAAALPGGIVDLSIGTPCDPPPGPVLEALVRSGAERGYPPSVGTQAYREACASWMDRRFGVSVDPAAVAACVGTKEFVVSLPTYLRLRTPERDTVLYPEVSYPSYEMGATLAGCRGVAVPVDHQWRLDVDAIDPADAARALCLWVNTPGNPAGGLDDLAGVAEWGRARGVPVVSDECYIEFTWATPFGTAPSGQPGRTILEHGSAGVLAVHSLSKRSNLAGIRAGFYAGDPSLVHYLAEVRKHAGLMVPGPVQAAAVAALGDDSHVDQQRAVYRRRLARFATILTTAGHPVSLPDGAFYLWVPAPDGDAWAFTRVLAEVGGCLVAPSELYGRRTDHVRVAVVQPDERLELVAERLAAHR
jgi:succinyldiaminopimelate transaminase